MILAAPCAISCASNSGHDHADHHDHESEHHHEAAEEEHHHHDDAHSHGVEIADEKEQHAHNDGEIILHAHQAEEFGVKTTIVQPCAFFQTFPATGKILNSPNSLASIVAPVEGTVTFRNGITPGSKVSRGTAVATVNSTNVSGGDSNKAAKARLEAAKRELDRLTPLLADGIITKAQFNAAQSEYEQAKAQYAPNADSGAAKSPIAGTITAINVNSGEYVAAGQPIATVAESSRLTLQVDVPAAYSPYIPTLRDAVVKPGASSEWITLSDIGGVYGGPSPASASPGYTPVFFSITNNGLFVPGTYVEVMLRGNERADVLTVPAAAISEQQGVKFVYRRLDEDGYEKKPVTTGATDGINVEILGGISAGDEIVTSGVTFVKLAETSGAVPEGHSHHH